jgi:hypothetical protein
MMIPHLREKRPQAELALKLHSMLPRERFAGVIELKAMKRVDYGETA